MKYLYTLCSFIFLFTLFVACSDSSSTSGGNTGVSTDICTEDPNAPECVTPEPEPSPEEGITE